MLKKITFLIFYVGSTCSSVLQSFPKFKVYFVIEISFELASVPQHQVLSLSPHMTGELALLKTNYARERTPV